MADLLPLAFKSIVNAIVDHPQKFQLLNAVFESDAASSVSFTKSPTKGRPTRGREVVEFYSLPVAEGSSQSVEVHKGGRKIMTVDTPENAHELAKQVLV